MYIILILILCILLAIGTFLFLKKERDTKQFLVGHDILPADLNEFYYTVSNINFNAHYQRYHFYKEHEQYFFYHESRERPGEYGPCTEADIRAAGSLTLSTEEWSEFFSYLKDGHVRKRNDIEAIDTGSSGPWTYLYWQGDQSIYQEFHFASREKRIAFESYCLRLAEKN